MTLWSPPRISKSNLVATHSACAPLLNGLGNAERGAVARRVIHGLRAGRVAASEVEQALSSGQVGLLNLLASCTTLPATPTFARRALACVASRGMVSPQTMEGLLTWCRALLSAGHITVDEVHALNQSQRDTDLLSLVVAGWNRMVDSVVDGMGMGDPTAARCAYTLAPAAVLRAMDEAMGRDYGIDQFFDGGQHGEGVIVITDAWPCVDLIADPATEPAFYGALCHAWDTVAAKASLLVSSEGTDDYLGGMMSESLHDLGRTATWEGDVPHFTASAIADALEDIGWYPSEDFADMAATFLRHAKHDRAAREMDARARDAAVEGDAAKLALLAHLKRVADALPNRSRSSSRCELFYSSEGQAHFCALLAQHAGLAPMYEDQLNTQEGESVVFFSAGHAPKPAHLLAVAKEGIMQVAAASAAMTYIQEYNDATSSR